MADLASLTIEPAGADVQLTDRDAFLAHSTARPPAGCWSGWQVHPDTLPSLRKPAADDPPFSAPSRAFDLTALPVYLDGAVPVGVLRPVHVRPKEDPC